MRTILQSLSLFCLNVAVLACPAVYAYAVEAFDKLEKTIGIDHPSSYVFLEGLKPGIPISEQVFLIYLPGDNVYKDFETQEMCTWEHTPGFLRVLVKNIPHAVFIRMCPNVKSKALVDFIDTSAVAETLDVSIAEEKLNGRVDEVVRLTDRLIAKGADPRRIFLIGHSFGGWVALTVLKMQPLKINSAVVSAPASSQKVDYSKISYERLLESGSCDAPSTGVQRVICRQGSKKTELLHAFLKKSADQYLQNYKHQKAFLRSGNAPLSVLVFTYPKDVYNTPEDLVWLSQIPGVDFVVESCGEDASHETFYDGCFEKYNAQRIENFIVKKLPVVSSRNE